MKFHSTLVKTHHDSPLGRIVLAASDQGLAGLWFEDQRHLPPELLPAGAPGAAATWAVDDAHPVLRETVRQLDAYFAGTLTRFELPLDLSHGTPFQQEVWQALLAIGQGDTSSYSAVSQRIGKPAAVRAVGAAVGRNPVSIIVPCHRVRGADGSLTGYAGGLHRKTALLTLEGVLQEALI